MMFLNGYFEKKQDQWFEAKIKTDYPYEIVATLGKGSYGVAYLIRKHGTNEKLVLKRLKSKYKNKNKIKSKFHQEIEILRKRIHPLTPKFIEEGLVEGVPYFIMEYIDGKTFDQIIFEDEQKFSIPESVRIVNRLITIIMEIHSKGIIHRDLRIPNILIRDDELVIIDFGLACYVDHSFDMNKITNPKKAPVYISDLYYIGHFFLFLLYSSYTAINKKEKSWQEELKLPADVQLFIEKLLLIQPAFSSAEEALETLHTLNH